MYKAKIHVGLRVGIKDSEGEAIQKSLHTLGYDKVDKFSIGKFMTMDIGVDNKEDAENQVREMCEKMLANTVIEDYKFEVECIKD